MFAMLSRPIDLIRFWWRSFTQRDQLQTSADARKSIYAINQLMYDGAVYFSRANGGCLEDIMSQYCGATYCNGDRIVPHFLPAKEIAEFYVSSAFAGQWGRELRPIIPFTTDPVADPLQKAMTEVWNDSNMASEKTRISRLAAVDGTVGLRPYLIPGTERVVIGVDKADRLFNVELDAAGNVVAVVLKYTQPFNRGTRLDPDYEDVDVVEEITKESFSLKYNGQEQIPADDRKNSYGFCPYVLLRHRDNPNGGIFGDYAWKGSEAAMHDVNWRITRQGVSIDRTMFAEWFIAAGGNPPIEIPMGNGQNAHYTQQTKDTPPPVVEAITPDIDQEHAQAYAQMLMTMMRGRQPELIFGDVQLLSGISGETIAQVMKPAEAAVDAVRPNYDHAFVRALQMAVSIRIDQGLTTDLGTSGDGAYQAGKLDFAFADRPALPQTVFQQVQQSNAEQAPKNAKLATANQEKLLGVDHATYLGTVYGPKEAERIAKQKAQVDVTTDNTL